MRSKCHVCQSIILRTTTVVAMKKMKNRFTCDNCQKERKKNYDKKTKQNTDSRRNSKKMWREKNRDAARKMTKDWEKKNIDRVRENNKKPNRVEYRMAYMIKRNSESVDFAFVHKERWTNKQDTYLINNCSEKTTTELATILGRTICAIKSRLHLLRKKAKCS